MGPVDFLRAKLDIYKLEQRYTKGRDRRTHFSSNARYVDGEYIYDNDSRTDTYTASPVNHETRHLPSFTSHTFTTPRNRIDPVSANAGFGTTTTVVSTGTLSPSTTSSSLSPSSAESSPSRSQVMDRDSSGTSISDTTYSSRFVDHESYTYKGALPIGREPPFSGDAESAWTKLAEPKDPSTRKSFMRRSVSWMS